MRSWHGPSSSLVNGLSNKRAKYVRLYVQFSDAVDNGHNKKAVQIADKILKKQGDLHCAKVGEKNSYVHV